MEVPQTRSRNFSVGDAVLFRNYSGGYKWQHVTLQSKVGYHTYSVMGNNCQTCQRHGCTKLGEWLVETLPMAPGDTSIPDRSMDGPVAVVPVEAYPPSMPAGPIA
ncbi:hypothetical protein PR048_006176, partial [Dryococelus australis]